MQNTGIIILAAGPSTRLGRPKQLLAYRGKTLLQHVADEALLAELDPVIVVIGAQHNTIEDSLDTERLRLVINENWRNGMATGIAKGIPFLGEADSLIISVCDQPFLTARIFERLISAGAESGKGIVASSYADTIGTPVLFSKDYFMELGSLKEGDGAKQLLKRFPDDLTTIDFAQGAIDIDTEEDYARLVDDRGASGKTDINLN